MVWQDLVENLPKWLKPFIHKPSSSSNTQVLVMKTPPEETKKKEDPKLVFQESSCPNLIDKETEMRPPPYVPSLQIHPRREAPAGEPRRLRGPTGTDHEGEPALGTRGKTRGDTGGLDPGDLELPSSTVQALPVRVGPANPESEPISTGPFPRVTCTIGRPKTILSQRNPKASLTS